MEIKHMHAMIVLTFVFLGALFLVLDEMSRPAGPTGAQIAQSLYMKAIALGENSTQYEYAYSEASNGYPEEYLLMSDGQKAYVKVVSPVSTKKIYLLENDTILCIRLLDQNESCESVENSTITQSYISGIEARLFSKGKIALARSDAQYRIDNGFQNFSDDITARTLQGGEECIEVKHAIDYSNASMQEMSRFGLVSGSPMRFDITTCIDNQTGEMYENRFGYMFSGKKQSHSFRLISSDFSSSQKIIAPAEVAGGAVDSLILESSYRLSLINCYLQPGSEQERCIATEALRLRYAGLCKYSGARTDRCLVSIVPLTKDISICSQVKSQDFLDDCHIELAGAYKDSAYCDLVSDKAKKGFCMNISEPGPAGSPEPEENLTEDVPGNSTAPENQETEMNGTDGLPKIISDILKELEGTANGTG